MELKCLSMILLIRSPFGCDRMLLDLLGGVGGCFRPDIAFGNAQNRSGKRSFNTKRGHLLGVLFVAPGLACLKWIWVQIQSFCLPSFVADPVVLAKKDTNLEAQMEARASRCRFSQIRDYTEFPDLICRVEIHTPPVHGSFSGNQP